MIDFTKENAFVNHSVFLPVRIEEGLDYETFHFLGNDNSYNKIINHWLDTASNTDKGHGD